MTTVLCENIHKKYPMGKSEAIALQGVSVDIADTGLTILAGPSGSGKSTLLNIIGLVDHPTEGLLHINGSDTQKMRDRERVAFRKHHIGYVFQQFHLIPVLTAYENVEYPLMLLTMSAREKQDAIEHMLHAVGMWEFRHHRPAQLSGGQQQRISIARALVKKPSLVLADEPTANLDSHNGHVIIELLHTLSQEHNTVCLIASHDPAVIAMGRRVISLHDGLIKEDA